MTVQGRVLAVVVCLIVVWDVGGSLMWNLVILDDSVGIRSDGSVVTVTGGALLSCNLRLMAVKAAVMASKPVRWRAMTVGLALLICSVRMSIFGGPTWQTRLAGAVPSV